MNKSSLNDLAEAIHSYYDNANNSDSFDDINKTKMSNENENEESWGNDVEFITEGVLLITISILGFLGNSMSIYVLLR